MNSSHKLVACNWVDLNEQVMHSVREYQDFTEPPLNHLNMMLLNCKMNIDFPALTGAKSITMAWEVLILC